MRVLRIRVDERQVIELHPAVTVVDELDDAQRTTCRQAFAALATGLAPATTGLLEAHGVLLDLDQDALDLLGIPDDPADVVVTPAHVPGAVGEDDVRRLRTAERDVRVLAADRHRAADALAAWRARERPAPGRDDPVASARRADELRAALRLHETLDAEPVRRALDGLRDAVRALALADADTSLDAPRAAVATALADVGLDVRGHDLPLAEIVRIADDWLDEVRRRGSWAVGAAVELQGIEASLDPRPPGTAEAADQVRAEIEQAAAAAAQATRFHADALVRADTARVEASRAATPAPRTELEWFLLGRLADHRQARFAGSVPLVLDGVFASLPDEELGSLLDRLAHLAGGVQLVVLGDDPRPARWAREAGARRAAAVIPHPATEVGCPR